jgi:Fur family ferric uptake transcriptional regulator
MPQRRQTQQRKVIETILEQTERPLSPNELLSQAQQTIPGLGIATVFRALKELVADGLVHTVHIADETPRYEGARAHHHHFKCVECGTVFDVFGNPGDLKGLLPPGFLLLDHQLTLFGRCSRC